ncbi:MAG TPA: LamG domain-containing protein, partial [Chromatiales bacterium]|nr:LamG domain-containing protein [Chromatiales bacterium]
TLIPPAYRAPGSSRVFPPGATDNSPNSFAETVYPVLRANCAGCHSETAPAASRQSPFFSSPDVNTAYEEAKAKMDLSDGDIDPNSAIDMDPNVPATQKQEKSRLVIRLRDESHNCFNNNSNNPDCQFSALTMRNAIIQFASGISVTGIDPALVTSGALTFGEGLIASGGNRYENNIIAKWEFKAGAGNVVSDVSGIGEPLTLTLTGNYSWVGGYGIEFAGGRAQASITNSKLYDRIDESAGGSGEYSIEAWVVPANVSQQDRTIIGYDLGNDARNFNLAQNLYNYEFRNRTSTSDANGNPALATPDAAEVLQATLQHVVITSSPTDGRRIFVNGVEVAADPAATPINTWGNNYAFVLGADATGNNNWLGKVRFAAIFDRLLTPAQILQNYDAGVGEKRYLLFDVGNIDGVPAGSYIMFEVTQFDSYSYLFNQPVFINLDASWTPAANIPIKGIRLGINGRLATLGQAYAPINTSITAAEYDSDTGQTLSTIGTIIPLENGLDSDEFFLSFEIMGNASNPFVEYDPVAPPRSEPVAGPDIGLRTFEEINVTMSELTGVPITNPAIGGANGTYTVYRQQFPSVENISTFLPAHQMAIAQLAMTYCDDLVNNRGTIDRAAYFPGVDFGAALPANRSAVIDPLLIRMMNVDTGNGPDLTSQPAESELRAELDSLMTTMCNASACSNGARTVQVVTAACAVALGSATMLVQ